MGVPTQDRTPSTTGRKRILVVEPLADEGLDILRADHEVEVKVGMPRDEFLRVLPEYDALLVRSQVQADAEAIAAGTRLQVIGRAGVGVDNIDLPAATEAGIVVVNAPTGNTIAAAEHTLALLFALARHIPEADASLRRGEWKRAQFTGRELRGKTLGIIGLGKIGMTIADRARAMEMEVLGHDPYVTEDAAALHGVKLLPMEDLIRRADAITVHVPLTRSTRNLIGDAEIALDEAGRVSRERRPRRRDRGGRAGEGPHRRTARRCRGRRLHRGAAQGIATPLGAQHHPDAASRRVDGRGTDPCRGRSRRAGAGRPRGPARPVRGERTPRAAGDGPGPRAVHAARADAGDLLCAVRSRSIGPDARGCRRAGRARHLAPGCRSPRRAARTRAARRASTWSTRRRSPRLAASAWSSAR